jgi:hypothetical protein
MFANIYTIILRLNPSEIIKKYKIKAPYVHTKLGPISNYGTL